MFERENTEIERAIAAQNLKEILEIHSAKINAEIPDFKLSPQVIYCQKTGQPIGQLDNASLITSLTIHGRDYLADALYNNASRAVHPAWIKTASNERYNETLDKLCDADPQGYAVYALGFICASHYKIANSGKFKNAETFADYHWALARTWQILSLVPKKDLGELNDALCSLLVYAPDSLRYLTSSPKISKLAPDILARLAVNRELVGIIELAIDRMIEGIGKTKSAIEMTDFVSFAKPKLTKKNELRRQIRDLEKQEQILSNIYHDTRRADDKSKLDDCRAEIRKLHNAFDNAPTMHETQLAIYQERSRSIADAARGPANIRRQRRAKARIVNDELRARTKAKETQIKSILAEFGEALFGKAESAQKSSWLNRQEETPKNELSAIDLEFVAALSLDDIGPEDQEDNEPTMRRITWAELQAQGAQEKLAREKEMAERLANAPAISLAERLARHAVLETVTPIINTQTETAKPIPAFFARFEKKD